jgi:hypothetical protein
MNSSSRSASAWAVLMRSSSTSRIADSDEAPGLHQADARRHMRGAQQAPNQRLVERLGQKVAHVAPHGYYAVDGRDFLRCKITHVCFASLD